MKELEKLKEMLCEELKKYGKKDDLTAGSLDVVDKLTHTVKNLDKIIESYEDGGYSNRNMPMYYYDGSMGGGNSYEGGMSYARGDNRGRGSNAQRDSRGRYSSRGGYSRERGYSRDGIADKLRELMEDAPDEKTRMEIERLADKMEAM